MNFSLRILTFLFFIISFLVDNSQARSQNNEPVNKLMYIEKNILPSSNGIILYVSYKIPFCNLVFVKKEDKFFAGLKIEFELFQSGKVIARESSSKSIFVDNYDETKSKDKYIEGLTKFDIKNDNYTILPSLYIQNTNTTVILDSLKVIFNESVKGGIFSPMIAENKTDICGNSFLYKNVNLQNSVPFRPGNYLLIIPVKDTSTKQLIVKIEQSNKLVFEDTSKNFISSQLVLKECNSIVGIFNSNVETQCKYFIIDNFNYKLNEGIAKLLIYIDNKHSQEFNLNVLWENKPISLNDILFSIEILEVIEDKNIVVNLMNHPRHELYKHLVDYWDKKYPKRKFAFNELMNEFYNRVDYAINNFSTIANKNGAKTDRGRIYIKYGKPDKIFREYSDNNVAEIWYYKTINKQFVFVDNTGLGDYTLEK